jgi:hypothetical protein
MLGLGTVLGTTDKRPPARARAISSSLRPIHPFGRGWRRSVKDGLLMADDGDLARGQRILDLLKPGVAFKVAVEAITREIGKQQTPDKKTDKPPRTDKKTAGNATVSARMIDAYQKDADKGGWSAQQWADHLNCSKTAVAESQAWKSLKLVKADQKLSKAKSVDKRRR